MKAYLFIMNLLVPLIMIGAGYFMLKCPPAKINRFFGYRTARSMRNADTWRFAHEKAGSAWMKWGVILLAASAAVQIPLLFLSVDAFSYASLVVLFAQTAVLLISIVPVERALKKEFGDK